jgi:hypothetical protein
VFANLYATECGDFIVAVDGVRTANWSCERLQQVCVLSCSMWAAPTGSGMQWEAAESFPEPPIASWRLAGTSGRRPGQSSALPSNVLCIPWQAAAEELKRHPHNIGRIRKALVLLGLRAAALLTSPSYARCLHTLLLVWVNCVRSGYFGGGRQRVLCDLRTCAQSRGGQGMGRCTYARRHRLTRTNTRIAH